MMTKHMDLALYTCQYLVKIKFFLVLFCVYIEKLRAGKEEWANNIRVF